MLCSFNEWKPFQEQVIAGKHHWGQQEVNYKEQDIAWCN
jgi:hypothetical protein